MQRDGGPLSQTRRRWLRIDGVCGEDSNTDAKLLSLRPLLKPQKSMVMYFINSGGGVGVPTSLKVMAVAD